MSFALYPHPDSCSCDYCRKNRSTRRRVHGDYQARKFWESCVIAGIATQHPSPLGTADVALEAWRERWEKPAEVHSPDYAPPEEEGGNDYAATRYRSHVFTPWGDNPDRCQLCGTFKAIGNHIEEPKNPAADWKAEDYYKGTRRNPDQEPKS